LGGNGQDSPDAIAVDSAGYLYVAGDTTSTDFPQEGAYQGRQTGKDCFVTKLNPTVAGSGALLYSTYLGGSGDDLPLGLAVESPGVVYVVGQTLSTDFPTRNALMSDPGDVNYDAFLAKLNTTASGNSSLLYSTYLGGSLRDGAFAVAADGTGTAYIAGYTYSSNFPTTPQGLQTTKQGDTSMPDGFLVKLTPAATLAAPGSLIATAISPTRIQLSWVDNTSTEGGFSLERSTDGGSTWPEVRAVAPTAGVGSAVNFTVVSLDPGVTYTFRVRAYQGSLYSPYTAPKNATTQTAPTAPTLLSAAPISTTRIQLTWRDNARNEQGFHVERSTNGGITWPVTNTAAPAAGSGATVSYTAINLNPSTAYAFRVRAYNQTIYSTYVGPQSATTLSPPVPPVAPGSLAGMALSPTRIQVSWVDNASDEGGFSLERSADGGATWPVIKAVSAAAGIGTTVSNTVIDLAPGTTYRFRVRAYRGTLNSAYAGPISVATQAAPVAPSALTATAISPSRIQLTWRDNASNEQSFYVERSTNNGATWPEIRAVAAAAGTGSTVSLTIVNLPPGATYTFRVRAYSQGAYSGYSNIASAPL
jgi:predicted phage tail protein